MIGISEGETRTERRQALQQCAVAFRLASHILLRDPGQLTGQMFGRLSGIKSSEIQQILRNGAAKKETPWLRPLSPCLTPPGGPLLRTLEGHSAAIEALTLFDGNRKAITGAEDGSLIIWDLERMQELRRLEGHQDAILAIAVLADDQLAVSASRDGTLKIWDLDDGWAAKRTLTGHTQSVTCLALLPDGCRAVSGSWDSTLRLWDLDRGIQLKTLLGHSDKINAVVISADGQHAFSASADGTIREWNLESGQELRVFPNAGRVDALVLFGGKGAISAAFNKLTIWDLEAEEKTYDLEAHLGPVEAIAVYAGGRRAVTGGLYEGDIRVWDLQTGEQLFALDRVMESVTRIVVTEDGQLLVAGGEDGSLRFLVLESGNELLHTVHDRQAIAVSPDGHRFLSVSETVEASGKWYRIEVRDLWGCFLERTLSGHKSSITRAVIFDDGRRAITASWDPSLNVWDLEAGCLLTTLVGHKAAIYAVAVFPDGCRAVSGAWDKTVRIWDLQTGRESHILIGHTQAVNAVAVCGSGDRVISGSDDGILKLWDAELGIELLTLTGHSDGISSIAVSPDGERALSGSGDNTLILWDLQTGHALRTLVGHEGGGIMAVEIFAGGRLAISAGADSNLKIWDLEQGAELRTLTAHVDIVLGVTVVADGRKAVSNSADGTIRVWNLDTVNTLAATRAHTGEVKAVAVHNNDKRAISVALLPTEIRAWDLATGKQIAPLVQGIGPLDQVKLFSETERLQITSWKQHTRSIWNLASGDRFDSGSINPEQISGMTAMWIGRTRACFTGKDGLLVWDLPPTNRLRLLMPNLPEIHAMTVYADEKRALAAEGDGKVHVLDLETGQDSGGVRAHNDIVLAIAVSIDDRHAVSGSKDGTVCLWDLEASTIRVVAALSDHPWGGHPGTLITAGRFALWGGSKGTITICDLEPGHDLFELTGHTDRILALAASRNGMRAVSGSQDRTVRVWDLDHRQEIAIFSADGSVDTCALSQDGSTVIAGDRVGQVHILRLERVSPKPVVVTAWSDVQGLVTCCPACQNQIQLEVDQLGCELNCPTPGCELHLKIYPFIKQMA